MKTSKILVIIGIILLIAACRTTKKGATQVSPSTDNFVMARPADGIHAPGNEELAAIQARYKEVTLDQLNEGHVLYTEGACINCHGAKNIYSRGETEWKEIIEDMAQRSNISDAQKDAVYKYVLSIKATQPK